MAELVSDAPGAAEKSKETFEPPMSLAQSVFRHGRNPTPASEKEILDLVTQRQMAPYYARVCAAFAPALAVVREGADEDAPVRETGRARRRSRRRHRAVTQDLRLQRTRRSRSERELRASCG